MATYNPAARYEIKVWDVEFRKTPTRTLMARIYQPQGPGPFPTLLDVHGGAWHDKDRLATSFSFMRHARTVQEGENTVVVTADMPSGPVKLSFFGAVTIGRINEPLRRDDSTLLVASLEDLLATKLKAILDRAEAKDYLDISAMLSANVSLARGLGGFAGMYGKDPSLALRAIGYFKDGDLPSLPEKHRNILRAARDRVSEIPRTPLAQGSLAGAL